MKKISFLHIILSIFVLFFVVGYLVYPLFQLISASFAENDIYSQLLSSNILRSSFNSIFLSIITIVGCAIIGVYFAYIFQYTHFRFKSFFSTLILLPISIPPMVGVMSFLFLLGENGLLSKLLPPDSFSFDGWKAIIFIHLYSFYPLFFLFADTGFKNLDNHVIEAAYSLGASRWKTFYSIIFPQIIPSIIGASLLVFMASMASFSAPFIFGGSDRFLTTEIYYAKVNGDYALSAALSVLLTSISVAFLFLSRWYRNRQPLQGKIKGTGKKQVSFDKEKTNYVSLFSVIIFAILLFLPILALFTLALLPENALMQSSLSYDLTFDNFTQLFGGEDFLLPFFNSLKSSLIAIIFTILIAMAAAYLLRNKKNSFTASLEVIISLPYSIPGTVIAICLIMSYNVANPFAFNQVLVGTFWILPIAYTIRNLPILTQSLIAGLRGIDTSVEEAAATLGAGKIKIFSSITLPLLVPSLIQGALLVFINAFGEFVATILLYGVETKTITVEIYSQLRLDNNGLAASYGVILFLGVLCVVFLSRKNS